MLHLQKSTGIMLHPNLPITANSIQQLLFSVPKVALVERFDNVYLTCT